MKTSFRHLVILILSGVALMFIFGCSQKDDIVQPKQYAQITLKPTNLPTLSNDYVYELWVVTENTNDSTYVSLGKFTYNFDWNRFYDVNGMQVSPVFEVPDPWLSYDYIMVTIENRDDPNPAEPSGTIMLMDNVVDPVTRPVEMKFPADFFFATGYYFVGTPTDKDRFANEDKGLWICSRNYTFREYQDTFDVSLTTVEIDQNDSNLFHPDTIGITNVVTADSTIYVISLDTIWTHHRVVSFDFVDTVDTNKDYRWTNLDWVTGLRDDMGTLIPNKRDTIYYFEYLGPVENLPDLTHLGWQYSAYALINDDQAGFPTIGLTSMVKYGGSFNRYLTGDSTWSVLPLGAFNRSDSADLSNTHLENKEVPNFPGEDFLVNASQYANLDLFRPSQDFWGSVIVGLQPNPANLTVNQNTNFPLYILVDSLSSGLSPDAHNVQTFHNWCQELPTIGVEIYFHE